MSVSPLSVDIRRYAIEVIDCRHCNKVFQTSEKHLCKALLCQSCFDSRELYRQEFKKKHGQLYSTEKTEWNILGDKYGDERNIKTVVCAFCGVIYDLIPLKYPELDFDAQKTNYQEDLIRYNMCMELRKRTKPDQELPKMPPFKPVIFDFTNAKKGWKNEILCQTCFNNIQVGYEDELNNANDKESVMIQVAVERKRLKDIEDYKAMKRNNRTLIVVYVFIFFMLVSAISSMCSVPDRNLEPTDMYFRR